MTDSMVSRAVFLAISLSLLSVGCGRRTETSRAPPPAAAGAASGISPALLNYYILQKTGVAADQVDAKVRASLLNDLQQLKRAADIEAGNADSATQAAIELQRIEFLAHAGAV